MKLVKKSITIREDQAEWLEKVAYIDLSKFVRIKLDEVMKKWKHTDQ